MFSLGKDSAQQWLVITSFLFAAVLTGLVVSTGKPVLIAVAMGGLLGLVMLNYLSAAVWMLVAGVLLAVGPIGYFLPALSKLNWLFSVLGFFLLGASLLHMGIGRQHFRLPMPIHVRLAVVLLVYAGLSLLFSEDGSNTMIGAFKRQFHFFGLMMVMAFVPFTVKEVSSWLRFLVVVGLVQLPLSLYQRFVLVPKVEGLEKPGFVALDIVVGTFEGSPTGGGASAVMAMYLVLVGVGLIAAMREKLITRKIFWPLLVLTLVPLGLGETKVVLLLLPLALLGAFGDTISKRPVVFLGGTIATLLATAVLVYVYFLVQVDGRQMTFGERFQETMAYNIGNSSYYGTGVNRMTAVPYWFESHHLSDPARALFGYGMGAGFGGDGRTPDTGNAFEAHSGMHIDLTAASALLWDYGLVGTVIWILITLFAWRACMRSLASAVAPLDRTLCRALSASLVVSLLMLIYSSSVLLFPTHTMLYWFTLGLVAWRVRHGPIEWADSGSNFNSQTFRQSPVQAGNYSSHGNSSYDNAAHARVFEPTVVPVTESGHQARLRAEPFIAELPIESSSDWKPV